MIFIIIIILISFRDKIINIFKFHESNSKNNYKQYGAKSSLIQKGEKKSLVSYDEDEE